MKKISTESLRAPMKWGRSDLVDNKMKIQLMYRLITFIIITTFLCQDIAFAKGPGMLMPESKACSIAELIGIDPSAAWRIFQDSAKTQDALASLTLDEFVITVWTDPACQSKLDENSCSPYGSGTVPAKIFEHAAKSISQFICAITGTLQNSSQKCFFKI